MSEVPAALADFLDERRRQFAIALPERAAQVESRWRAIAAPWNPRDLLAVETAAHGLAGTAEMLGYKRFGTAAHAVERALRELRLSGAPSSPEGAGAVESALRAMSSALEPDP